MAPGPDSGLFSRLAGDLDISLSEAVGGAAELADPSAWTRDDVAAPWWGARGPR
jgi:hypothetical protein